jgi:hypothetical protein
VETDGETGSAEPEDLGERERSVLFLQKLLANGPQLGTEVKRLALVAGIADRTLTRAKLTAGVVSIRRGGLGRDGWWEWSLP